MLQTGFIAQDIVITIVNYDRNTSIVVAIVCIKVTDFTLTYVGLLLFKISIACRTFLELVCQKKYYCSTTTKVSKH
jgi:hypothetical protein